MAGDPRILLQNVRSHPLPMLVHFDGTDAMKQADKALASASRGLSFFGGREEKYSQAADLYVQAANGQFITPLCPPRHEIDTNSLSHPEIEFRGRASAREGCRDPEHEAERACRCRKHHGRCTYFPDTSSPIYSFDGRTLLRICGFSRLSRSTARTDPKTPSAASNSPSILTVSPGASDAQHNTRKRPAKSTNSNFRMPKKHSNATKRPRNGTTRITHRRSSSLQKIKVCPPANCGFQTSEPPFSESGRNQCSGRRLHQGQTELRENFTLFRLTH